MAALLHFDDEAGFATRLAEAASLVLHPIARPRFPDGELKLTLPTPLPARCVLLRSLAQPNEKLVELLLAARAARALGARELVLVAPYLAYMRQDTAFAPGEAVSQRSVGTFLADLFDAVITVDPHLHRVARLDVAVPTRRAVALSAAALLGELPGRALPGALLLGPDEESAPWVQAAAAAAARIAGVAPEAAVCRKERHGDREVAIALPAGVRAGGRTVVLVDDVASTARTLAQAAQALRAAGAARVAVAVTHALFVDDALAVLRAAGVLDIWSTDTVPHPSNRVSVVPLLAESVVQSWG
jgi:ribose-phosphate pyrophosphokinase